MTTQPNNDIDRSISLVKILNPRNKITPIYSDEIVSPLLTSLIAVQSHYIPFHSLGFRPLDAGYKISNSILTTVGP